MNPAAHLTTVQTNELFVVDHTARVPLALTPRQLLGSAGRLPTCRRVYFGTSTAIITRCCLQLGCCKAHDGIVTLQTHFNHV